MQDWTRPLFFAGRVLVGAGLTLALIGGGCAQAEHPFPDQKEGSGGSAVGGAGGSATGGSGQGATAATTSTTVSAGGASTSTAGPGGIGGIGGIGGSGGTASTGGAGGGSGCPCKLGEVCDNGSCVADPCATAAFVGDPNCVILEIVQSGIGSAGFTKTWRGQDITFATQALVTGIEFNVNSTPTIGEIRLMTSVANLQTLSSSLTIASHPDGFSFWEGVSLPSAVPLTAGTEYTIWFHLLNANTTTVGADLSIISPTMRGHHTNVDPNGQVAGAYPEWNYEYGTNCRVYGVLGP